jgi:alkanesulfonate monooxygenase SsuD/methylene tetrahydromethanopterin reductase-like flavin-dependent oxidoreductase (luciferase family)
MPAASRQPEFGISVIPNWESVDRTLELVRGADEAGLGLIGVQDHPYQHHFLDTFALVATLLAETRRISIFTDVANLPLRLPAVMAKAAASLDVLSSGRFELGLGAGANWPQIAGMGGPSRTGPQSVEALEDAIEVIRLMWSGQRSVSFDGEHYRLEDARPGPQPVHSMGIWLGAFRPRAIRLAGRKADGWIPSLGPLSAEDLLNGNKLIDEAAEAAGRDPGEIRRVLNVQGLIGVGRPVPNEELPVGYIRVGEPLAGPPEWWAEKLAGFAEDGFDTLVFWPADPTPEQVEVFAREVVPLLGGTLES